ERETGKWLELRTQQPPPLLFLVGIFSCRRIASAMLPDSVVLPLLFCGRLAWLGSIRSFPPWQRWSPLGFQTGTLVAKGHRFIDLPHRRHFKRGEQLPHRLPQGALWPLLRPRGAEQGVALLLHLVDPKRQHHQQRHYHSQVLLSVTVVVLKMIALVLQGVERLVLDVPPRPRAPPPLVE